MYVGLHWIYVTADTSSTIAVFLKCFAFFLEASVGLCGCAQLHSLKTEEVRTLLYLNIAVPKHYRVSIRVWHFAGSLL